MKTTIKILYDRGLFDSISNADEVLEDFFTRLRLELEKLNDDIR